MVTEMTWEAPQQIILITALVFGLVGVILYKIKSKIQHEDGDDTLAEKDEQKFRDSDVL